MRLTAVYSRQQLYAVYDTLYTLGVFLKKYVSIACIDVLRGPKANSGVVATAYKSLDSFMSSHEAHGAGRHHSKACCLSPEGLEPRWW
jgi:hypothetical protein